MCKYKCRYNRSVCNNKQRWNDDKCRCECKELNDKGVCNKGFIWNTSNCEYECYNKYKKRLVNKLVERSSAEECTENIDERRLVEINMTKCKHNSCTLYNVLFSTFFTINVGIGSHFLYSHWYLKKDVTCV